MMVHLITLQSKEVFEIRVLFRCSFMPLCCGVLGRLQIPCKNIVIHIQQGKTLYEWIIDIRQNRNHTKVSIENIFFRGKMCMCIYQIGLQGILQTLRWHGRSAYGFRGSLGHLGDGKHGWHGGASGFIWKGFKLQGNICMHYDTTVVSVSSGCH